MDIMKSFKISKITSLLYDLNLAQLDAVYDAIWRFKKEASKNGLQDGNTQTS